jgi:hypothetical protein
MKCVLTVAHNRNPNMFQMLNILSIDCSFLEKKVTVLLQQEKKPDLVEMKETQEK